MGFSGAHERFYRGLNWRIALPDVPTIAPRVNRTATHYKLISRRIIGHAVIATPSSGRPRPPARWTMTACEAMTAVNRKSRTWRRYHGEALFTSPLRTAAP